MDWLPEGENFFVAEGKPGPIPGLESAVEEKTQRARAVHLITLKMKGNLFDLRREIQNQTGIEISPGDVDLSRPVELDVAGWPVQRVLNHVGLDVDHVWTLKNFAPDPRTQYAEGIRFDFSAAPWEPEGKRLGWVVRTEARMDPNFGRASSGWIEDSLTTTWEVASVHSKDSIPFETCGIHSPALVYVPRPDPGPLTIRARCSRYWYLEIPIEFRDPKPTDVWKGRGFQINLAKWPTVEVKSSHPLPRHLLKRSLSEDRIECYFKNGQRLRLYDSMGVGGGGGGGGRYGGRFGEKVVYAWCGCRNQPARFEPDLVPTGDTLHVRKSPEVSLSRFKSVRIRFRALVQETFEVMSDSLPAR